MKIIYLVIGAGAGLLSGLGIGLILIITNALPQVVENFGAPSETAAFLIHLFSSTVMGTLFGIGFGAWVKTLGKSLLWASVFSLVLWLFASLVIKPIAFGGTFLQAAIEIFSAPNVLIGHAIFGLLLGGIFWWLRQCAQKYC